MPVKSEQTVSEATQIHLFLSIILLLLLTRFWGLVPDTFGEALFACISMPALYAMSYYTTRRYREVKGTFVKKRTGEPVYVGRRVDWTSEIIAILSSYFMGFIVFASFTGTWDIITYTIAFFSIQLMRLIIVEISMEAQKLGMDIQHPLMIVLISLTSATLVLLVLTGIFYFIGVFL